MNKTAKVLLLAGLLLVLTSITVLCACFGTVRTSEPDPEDGDKNGEIPSVTREEAIGTADQLLQETEEAILSGSYREIRLAGTGTVSSGTYLCSEDGAVTVTESGIYLVSGELDRAQLKVSCDGNVALILSDVRIRAESGEALVIKQAPHVLLYLPDGSSSELISGTAREIASAYGDRTVEEAGGAAVRSKGALSVAGTGTLSVGGYENNAISSDAHIALLDGTIQVRAVNNGLRGADSVTVLGGQIEITCGNDGIKTCSGDETEDGTIEILAGSLSIQSYGDGVQAARQLSVRDGEISVKAGDPDASYGAADSTESGNGGYGGFDFGDFDPNGAAPGGFDPGNFDFGDFDPNTFDPGGMDPGSSPPGGFDPGSMPGNPYGGNGKGSAPSRPDGGNDRRGQGGGRGFAPSMPGFDGNAGKNTDGPSAKGLKSGDKLEISGGILVIDSTDDCVHADGSVTVTGGTFTLSSGDDGIHADQTLVLSGGEISVLSSYEGYEAHEIYVSGGTHSVIASDDGFNACGGSSSFGFGGFGEGFGGQSSNTEENNTTPILRISDGTVYVRAGGDGLDSNGDLVIDGGSVTVDGPSDSANGALDSGSENGGRIRCNGGTVIAVGASGMAETFDNDSEQCSFLYNFQKTVAAGTEIEILDEDGRVLISHTAAKSFNSVVFSSPELRIGGTYTIKAGDSTGNVTQESVSAGNSSGFGGFGGFGRR